MKQPTMDELLRVVTAVGITVAVAVLAYVHRHGASSERQRAPALLRRVLIRGGEFSLGALPARLLAVNEDCRHADPGE